MKTIIKLKGDFKWPDRWNLDDLESVQPSKWSDYFKYEDKPHPQRFVTDAGNFQLHRDLESVYPGVYEYCATEISRMLGLNIKEICDARPDIAKTSLGGLTPHVDLGRPCAINIGLKNTNRAIFGYSGVNRFTDSETSTLEDPRAMRMVDKGAYLVAVCWPHCAIVEPEVSRYILTYACKFSYDFLYRNTRNYHDYETTEAASTVWVHTNPEDR
jgi:hypothetical protein